MDDTILQIRGPAWCSYVLRAPDGLYLIDSGFLGMRSLFAQGLRKRGWQREPVRGIVVTHGHLDHVLHIARIVRETGAWVAAPPVDTAHYEGRYPYRGPARVCGWLEAIGRRLLRYEPFRIDTDLEDGSQLPVWDGLHVVHLPGHTLGHIGLYCPTRKLLFSGDLFSSYGSTPRLPPAIFNTHGHLQRASVEKALALDLEGVLPNHGDKASPAQHLCRLRRLGEALG